ncbi:MAG TPA: hypothetical protein PLY23_08620 [Alphaproteobacteria bacterium]|nr:hypothetical protein [Alphaproteobacteria bacterium]HQS94706.1 hypothetical protein [Alphaproteobacteria bacterium]
MKLRNIQPSFLTLSLAGILSLSFLEGVYAVKVGLETERTPAKSKYLTEVRERKAEFQAEIDIRHERQEIIAVDRNQDGKEIARLDSEKKKFEARDWTSLAAGAYTLEDKGWPKSYVIEIFTAGSDIDSEKMGIFKKYGLQLTSGKSWRGKISREGLNKFATELAYADFDKNGNLKADPKMKIVLPDLEDATVSALKDQ